MKVKCITKVYCYLTIGKIYDVIGESENFYKIINNNNDEYWVTKKWFKPISEMKLLSDEVTNVK